MVSTAPTSYPAPGHSLEEAYRQAVVLYRDGAYRHALALAEQIVAAAPGAAPVLNLAAVCAQALAMLDSAERYCREAIAAQPGYANAYINLGLVLSELNRYEEAEASFARAAEIQPESAETHVNLGNLYRTIEQPREAEQSYRRALSIRPDHTDALYNLGLLLVSGKRAAEAEVVFLKALAVQPDQPVVYNDLGNALKELLRFAEAEAAYRRAIALSPNFVDAHFNLAILLMERKRSEEAWASLQHCLRLQPGHVNALNALGNLLTQAGRLEEGEKAYRRALACRTDSANIHGNLGNLLLDSKRYAEAEVEFRHAFALEPSYVYALGQASSCARQIASWARAEADEAGLLASLEQGLPGIPARVVMALPHANARHQLQAALLATGETLQPFLDRAPLHGSAPRASNDRIRVGYLSADFHEHAVMHLLAGVLESHDRGQFMVHAYSMGADTGDRYRRLAQRCVEVFRDVRKMSDAEAADLIVADRIDILVDLAGHTKNARPCITASRPAPVIVNWLGYPATLGHARLADYIIGDAIATPADQAGWFSEALTQMPHCCLPNDRMRQVGAVPSRVEEGLPVGAFVFANFNLAFKLIPETFDVWCRLLRDIPGSLLWMASPTQPAIENLRKEAALRKVDPDRIVFAERKPDIADHLGRLALADLALDTYPYTSHSTGCDALWAGLPLITKMGDTFASRIAASLLHAVGLPELVADSWKAYYQLAYSLATRPETLSAVREKLARNRLSSPLFDTTQFTLDLESLYRAMWAQHLDGKREPILNPLRGHG